MIGNILQLATLLSLLLLPCISSTSYNVAEVRDRWTVEGLMRGEPGYSDLERAIVKKMQANPSEYPETLEGAAKAADSIRVEDKFGPAYFVAHGFNELPAAAASCDRDSFNILRGCFMSLNYRETNPTEAKKVGSFVMEAIEKHGNLCRPNYLKRFEQLSSDQSFMDAFNEVDKTINSEVIEIIFSDSDPKSRIRMDVRSQIVAREELMNIWKNLAADDFAKFVRTKLNRPCANYYMIADEIFLPARMDLILDDDRISEINPSDKFMNAWLKFRICSAILHDIQGIASYIDIDAFQRHKSYEFSFD